MKTYRYKGIFKNAKGHLYELEVSCIGFLEAFFLLTADAIRTAQHYQLEKIIEERGEVRQVRDIRKCLELLYEMREDPQIFLNQELNIPSVVRSLSPEIGSMHYQERDINQCRLQALLTEAKKRGNLALQLIYALETYLKK